MKFLKNHVGPRHLPLLMLLFMGDSWAQAQVHPQDVSGCWAVESVTFYSLRGDKETRASQCFYQFEGEKAYVGCRQSNSHGNYSFRLLDTNRLEMTNLALGASKHLFEYQVDANRLQFNELSQSDESKTRYSKEMSAIRLNVAQGGACLPPIVVVTAKEFSNYYWIPKLVTAQIERNLRLDLALKFIEVMRGDIPVEGYPVAELKWLLKEFDQISEQLFKRLHRALSDAPQIYEQAYFSAYQYDEKADVALAESAKQKWAANVADELIKTKKIIAYLFIAGRLSPQVVAAVDRGAATPIETLYPDIKYIGIGESYLIERVMAVAIAEDGKAETALPLTSTFIRDLKTQILSNIETAKTRGYKPTFNLGQNVANASMSIISSNKELFTKIHEVEGKALMVGLAERFIARTASGNKNAKQ
jgi:hypothetical protein